MTSNLYKKIIPGIVLAAVCLSLLPIGVPAVRADTPIPGDTTDSRNSLASTNPNTSSTVGTGLSTASSPPPKPSDNSAGCGVDNGLNFSICITNVIYVFTVGIGSAFAYVAAFFFDLTIQLSLQSTAYALDFLSTGWTLARDLANMAFIFILVFIALTVMLEAEDTKLVQTLATVVVVALLVNFSFFFTRVAIDAGNLLSVQFYNAIQAPQIVTTAQDGSNLTSSIPASIAQFAGNGQMKDLTAGIMGMMQLQSLFGTPAFQSFANSGNSGFLTGFITLTFLYVAAGILYWGLIAMFVAVGIKFLMRIIVLWFLLIASPLAFVAKAMPNKLSGYYDEWQALLISHAFYPAGFLFVFFILTMFSNQLGGANLINGIFGGLSTTATGTTFIQVLGIAVANTAIRLGFVLGVMYIGMQASEFIGVMGAGAAKTAGNWAGGRFIGTAAGTIGFASRNSAGWASSKMANAGWLKDNVAAAKRVGGINSLLWRGINAGAQRAASGTYDVRNAPGASLLKKPFSAAVGAPVNTGTAATEGYKQAAEKREKADSEKEIRDLLKKAASNPSSLTPVERERLNRISSKEIETANGDHLVKAAEVFSEKVATKILDNENFGKKDAFHKAWHENAGGAPLQKADKMIDELQGINSRLATSLPGISALARTGATVDKTALNLIAPLLDTKLETARAERTHAEAEVLRTAGTGTSKADLARANIEFSNTEKAIKKLADATTATADVPPEAGGVAAKGGFKKK